MKQKKSPKPIAAQKQEPEMPITICSGTITPDMAMLVDHIMSFEGDVERSGAYLKKKLILLLKSAVTGFRPA